MIHYTSCPICKKDTIEPSLIIKDHSVSGEIFNVWYCRNCTFKFTQDIPEAESIGKYYASEAYVSHTDTKKGLINKLYHFVKGITLGRKRKMIGELTGLSKGNLLDIGCGTGSFLHEMKLHNWNINGIEADASARARAKENYRIEPSEPSLLKSLSPSFDVITMWHVLEHVHTLHEYIAECRRLLQKNGLLIIAVPNYTSGDAEEYKEFWAAWDVPRHLYHFSPQSMETLAGIHGFKVIQMKPMVFDSYYVSMLSEKYRSGGNLLKAFFAGWKSNRRASKNVRLCSSVIYILKSVDSDLK